MDVVSDPQNPGPGDTATLTITASGTHGVDKYGIKDVQVGLAITSAPGSDAKVEPASVTTDSSGTATAKLTTSRTKGKNVVTATAGSLTTDFNVDTLLGSAGTPVRGRHSGGIDPAVTTPALQLNPALIFAAAALILIAGFVIPYRRRLGDLGRSATASLRYGRTKTPKVVNLAAQKGGWGPSSPRTNPEPPKSATRGG